MIVEQFLARLRFENRSKLDELSITLEWFGVISSIEKNTPQILNNHISVQAAASYSGYRTQYLRRMLRRTKPEDIKTSQLWLFDKAALDLYIEQAQDADNQRFGPK